MTEHKLLIKKVVHVVILLSLLTILLVGCGLIEVTIYEAQVITCADTDPYQSSVLGGWREKSPTVVPGNTNFPKLVNHRCPDMTPDWQTALEAIGCEKQGDTFTCTNGKLASFECSRIELPSHLWAGLEPSYPVLPCSMIVGHPNKQEQFESEGYISRTGGFVTSYLRYIVVRNKEPQLIKNADELKEIFAPIESSEEALSYALITTDLDAYYGHELYTGYDYFTDVIEDTHVTEVSTGYIVNLFNQPEFGCDHAISQTLVVVDYAGTVTQSEPEVIYDNLMVQMCND